MTLEDVFKELEEFKGQFYIDKSNQAIYHNNIIAESRLNISYPACPLCVLARKRGFVNCTNDLNQIETSLNLDYNDVEKFILANDNHEGINLRKRILKTLELEEKI